MQTIHKQRSNKTQNYTQTTIETTSKHGINKQNNKQMTHKQTSKHKQHATDTQNSSDMQTTWKQVLVNKNSIFLFKLFI